MNSYVARRRPRRNGCNIVIRRSSNDCTSSNVSATIASSGCCCGITLTAAGVGPAVVVWIAGGRITISTTSREPPNSVTFGRVTVVHAAVIPAGMIVYASVCSPRFSIDSESDVVEPGPDRRLVLREPGLYRHDHRE